MNWYDETEALTKKLVEIKSVTESGGGEQRVAEFIKSWYERELGAAVRAAEAAGKTKAAAPLVRLFETENDTVKRCSVLAMVKGTKGGGSRNTVILLAHTDTVDVQDYGAAKDLATKPDLLPRALRQLSVSPEVLEDMESGDYMFGRGALDMKAGAACHMTLMKYFAANPDELSGNLISVCECDEEGNSAGIFSALKQLARLKQEMGLEYAACINSDYSTTERNDEKRYVYVGSIGKLLPCFAVFGAPAHVGQVFASLDPDLITAEITRRMCYNPAMCDRSMGEMTLPPVSLKQADTKESYTVQTAISSFSYYNMFLYSMTPEEALAKCKAAAIEAMDAAIAQIKESHWTWQKMAGTALPPLTWKTRVFLWSEYVQELLSALGEGFKTSLDEFSRELAISDPGMDLRAYSLKLVEFARGKDPDMSPAVIVFSASTYYPAVEISGRNDKEKRLLEAVKKAAAEVNESRAAGQINDNRAPGQTFPREIGVKMFYPYISDSSFMYDFRKEDGGLAKDMPACGYRYTHPLELIQAVDAPVTNIGTFGYDGHMFTERLEKKHSLETVPSMICSVIKELL